MSASLELERLVEMWTGIRPGTLRSEDALARHVEGRVRALGLRSVATYLERIRSEGGDGEEFRLLVRVVTNGQTHFFRDPGQLVELADHLARIAGTRHPHVWVAGCSTGEEAYTLAILCAERGVKVHVHATDLQDERVAFAEHGFYGEWAVRSVPAPHLARYFDRVDGGYRVRTSIRNRVSFGVHNLVDERMPAVHGRRVAWDAIVCRNVFIYWAPDRVAAVCRRLAEELDRGGLLVCGPSESLLGMDVPLVPFVLGARTVYRVPSAERGFLAVQRSAQRPAPEPEPEPAVPSWIGRLGEGHRRLVAHDFDEARERYEEAVAAAELEPEAHFFLGLVRLKLGQWTPARDSLRRALFLDPGCWPAALLVAGIHERRRDPASARRELRMAAEAIAGRRGAYPFRSDVRGIAAAVLTAEEAGYVIERRTASLGRALSKEARDG